MTNPASFRKPKFKAAKERKNLVISQTQDTFKYGAVKESYWGRSTQKEFQEGVKVLENFDITEQGTLIKRTGSEEDSLFKPYTFFNSSSITNPSAAYFGFNLLNDAVQVNGVNTDPTHITTKVQIKDFKIEEFQDYFVLVVCWKTQRVFSVGALTEQTASNFPFVRNDIVVYTGLRQYLNRAREIHNGESFFKFLYTSSFYPKRQTNFYSLKVRESFPLNVRGEVLGLMSATYSLGGKDTLSTKDYFIEGVRLNREALVYGRKAYPIAITYGEGEGARCNPLGFSGRLGFPRKEYTIKNVPCRVFERGFNSEIFSKEGIVRVIPRVFFEVNFGVPLTFARLTAPAFTFQDSNSNTMTSGVFNSILAGLPRREDQSRFIRRDTTLVRTFSTTETRTYVTATTASSISTVEQLIPEESGKNMVFRFNPVGSIPPLVDPSMEGFQLEEEISSFNVSGLDEEVRNFVQGAYDYRVQSHVAGFPLYDTSKIETDRFNISEDAAVGGSVFVRMDESILNSCLCEDTIGVGQLMVYIDEIEVADGEPLVVGGSAFFCEVRRYVGLRNLGVFTSNEERYPNAILTFFTQTALRNSREYFDFAPFGFKSRNSLFFSLNKQEISFRQFSLPAFSVGRGFPASVVRVDGKTVLSGYGSSRGSIGATASGSLPVFGFSNLLPDKGNIKFNSEQIEKVRSGEGHILQRPSSGSSPDHLYFFNIQLAPSSAPFEIEPDIGVNNEIFWVDTIRELIFGTRVEETRVRTVNNGPIGPINMDFRGFQSARGSGSSLTAKGDYSLFFVGPNKDQIYYFWFDDAIQGLRSMNANVIGGDLGTITDIRWDYRRKALWVLHDKPNNRGNISLFYLSKDYGIMGWGEYIFDGIIPSGEVPEHGTNRYKAVGLFHNEDRSVGFTAETGLLVRLPLGENADYADAGSRPIISRAEFFRNPPASKSGPATIWKKRPGSCDLLTRNVTEIYGGGRSRQDRGNFNREVRKEVQVGPKMYSYSLSGKEVSVLKDGKLFYVSMEHSKNEPAEILSISGRYEIMET